MTASELTPGCYRRINGDGTPAIVRVIWFGEELVEIYEENESSPSHIANPHAPAYQACQTTPPVDIPYDSDTPAKTSTKMKVEESLHEKPASLEAGK